MSSIIRQEKYIKSDVANNNNKFWYITLYDNGDCLTEWGRVGDKGQSKLFPGVGESFLEKKCHEKESYRNNEIPYRKLNVVGESNTVAKTSSIQIKGADVREIAKKQIRINNPIVAKLIEYFAKVNSHQITFATGGRITYSDTTGLFSTPLGIITQENIDEADKILNEIGDLVSKRIYDDSLEKLTNDFMMLVPQDIGHKRIDVRYFWSDIQKVQAQKQILDNLQASLFSADKISNKTKDKSQEQEQEKVFDCQMHYVEDGRVIDKIKKFYRQTHHSSHSCSHLDVKKVYSIDINTVRSAFQKDGSKMKNVWELWHGTRASNVLSILKCGLVIPPSSSPHVCGRMFGDGLYFSDQSTKSLNYSHGFWSKSGGIDDNCFMFLCSAGMGNYYIPKGPFSGYKPPKEYDSTFAKAGQSGVQNNEMIVYRTSQANLEYLVEFSPHGK
jgi:poly [ADP-ribose] polymerase